MVEQEVYGLSIVHASDSSVCIKNPVFDEVVITATHELAEFALTGTFTVICPGTAPEEPPASAPDCTCSWASSAANFSVSAWSCLDVDIPDNLG